MTSLGCCNLCASAALLTLVTCGAEAPQASPEAQATPKPSVMNGEAVIDRAEIPGIGGALDSDEAVPGPLMLQGDHEALPQHRADPGSRVSREAIRGGLGRGGGLDEKASTRFRGGS